MNKNIKLLIALIAICLIWYLTTNKTSSTSFDKNFTNFDPEQISKIDISKDSVITLSKVNNEWQIENYKANQSFITNTLNDIKNIRLSRKVTSKSDKHQTYEVAENGIKVTLNGDVNISFIIGKNGASYQNVFIRKLGEDDVYTTTKNFTHHFKRSISDWKDKTILNLKKDEIASISLNSSVFITNLDSVTMVKGSGKSETDVAGNSDVTSIFNSFSYMNTLGFPNVDATSLSTETTVIINEKDGDVNELTIYSTGSEDSKRYVSLKGNETIFEVNKASVEKFSKKYNDLKK